MKIFFKRKLPLLIASLLPFRVGADSSLDVKVDGAIVNVGGASVGLVVADQSVGTLDVQKISNTRVAVKLPAAMMARVALTAALTWSSEAACEKTRVTTKLLPARVVLPASASQAAVDFGSDRCITWPVCSATTLVLAVSSAGVSAWHVPGGIASDTRIIGQQVPLVLPAAPKRT